MPLPLVLDQDAELGPHLVGFGDRTTASIMHLDVEEWLRYPGADQQLSVQRLWTRAGPNPNTGDCPRELRCAASTPPLANGALQILERGQWRVPGDDGIAERDEIHHIEVARKLRPRNAWRNRPQLEQLRDCSVRNDHAASRPQR